LGRVPFSKGMPSWTSDACPLGANLLSHPRQNWVSNPQCPRNGTRFSSHRIEIAQPLRPTYLFFQARMTLLPRGILVMLVCQGFAASATEIFSRFKPNSPCSVGIRFGHRTLFPWRCKPNLPQHEYRSGHGAVVAVYYYQWKTQF
jgi:hypothetical protein